MNGQRTRHIGLALMLLGTALLLAGRVSEANAGDWGLKAPKVSVHRPKVSMKRPKVQSPGKFQQKVGAGAAAGAAQGGTLRSFGGPAGTP